jgi:uncharacterized membrane protein YeaQ/YmgE (transglycosylase-associated protein family)
MGTQSLLVFLIIGVVAGFLAGKIMKGKGFGFFGDLVVGVVGAFVGGWVFGMLGFLPVGILGTLISATAGAVILLFLIRLVKKA